MIRFVSYPGNHRNPAGENRPRHRLRVKTPQILHGPAPARHDDDLRPPFVVQPSDGAGDADFRALPLHRRRRQPQFGQRIAPPGYILNILPNGAPRRCYHSDDFRKHRQRPFPGRVKQPFRLQQLPQPFQFQRQRPGADRHYRCYL